MSKSRSGFLILFLSSVFIPFALAVGEIQVDKITLQKNPPHAYEISAHIQNQTWESREVVLRAQIFFFEQISPKGDIPAMILRKDETIILKSGEGRLVTVKLYNEGNLPKGNLRLEPEVRIRRQRPWSY